MSDLYTIRTTKGGFICSKLTDYLEVDEWYTLTESGKGYKCNCRDPRPYCKHMDILKEFKATDRVNTGWFYTSEKEWLPPVTL